MRMVEAGEVGKYEAVAGGGIVIFFFRMHHVFVWAPRSGGSVYCSSFFVNSFTTMGVYTRHLFCQVL